MMARGVTSVVFQLVSLIDLLKWMGGVPIETWTINSYTIRGLQYLSGGLRPVCPWRNFFLFERFIISEAYDSTCKLRCVDKLIGRHDVVVSSVLCMSRLASNAISVTGRPCELRYL